MRAIIIDDKDARALLDKLELEKFSEPAMFDTYASEAWQGLPKHIRDELLTKVHRKFHYEVCRWLQDQGANVVR